MSRLDGVATQALIAIRLADGKEIAIDLGKLHADDTKWLAPNPNYLEILNLVGTDSGATAAEARAEKAEVRAIAESTHFTHLPQPY